MVLGRMARSLGLELLIKRKRSLILYKIRLRVIGGNLRIVMIIG
jgi:hypothetical protein